MVEFNIVKGIPGISVSQKVENILELKLYVVRSYDCVLSSKAQAYSTLDLRKNTRLENTRALKLRIE